MLDTESNAHVTAKARALAKRGVRRLLYVRVSDRAVFEWAHDDDAWHVLADDGAIVDRCLTVPVPVRALASEILANNTVAEALLQSRNAVIEAALTAREQDGRIAGERDGRITGERDGRLTEKRGMVRRLRLMRGGLSAENATRIDACDDAETLDRWITRLLEDVAVAETLT